MITNFNKFIAECKATYWEFSADDLSAEEKVYLRREIADWVDTHFEAADTQLQSWYGMEVPTEILKAIASADLDLAQEIYTGGIGDTCQREQLADAVLKHIGLSRWPIYGDGEEASKRFAEQLKETAPKFGIKILS